MILVKNRSASNRNSNSMDWMVMHSGFPAANLYDAMMRLNLTEACYTTGQSSTWYANPNTTQFFVGTHERVNYLNDNYIAYLWSEVPGFSKFGSYTGNGSSDGPFVYCGFKPAWIMIKRTGFTAQWLAYDGARSPSNGMVEYLYPSATNAAMTTYQLDLLSNGFKLRNSDTASNGSENYIFAAFAEAPFKYASAR
jgi:hypothetical protein